MNNDVTTAAVTALSVLEAQATHYLETFKKSYYQFVECLITIRDTESWRDKDYVTWESYLESEWLGKLQVGYSRLRQIESAYPIMQAVYELTGATLTESRVRFLKKHIPEADRYLIPELVSYVLELDNKPTDNDFLIAYSVLKERRLTGAVSVDGEAINPTQIAVHEALLEARNRQLDHIHNNSKWEIVNKFAFTSAYDARQAFNTLAELQTLDSDMVITVQIKKRKQDETNDDTEVTEDNDHASD